MYFLNKKELKEIKIVLLRQYGFNSMPNIKNKHLFSINKFIFS